jgi:hypothetical protein
LIGRPHFLFSTPALWARAQRPQVMPVINPVVVAILPDDRNSIRAGWFDSYQMCGRRIFQLHRKNPSIRFGFHILMTASTLGAWTGRPQQGKGIDTDMAITPGDGHIHGLAVGSNVRRI